MLATIESFEHFCGILSAFAADAKAYGVDVNKLGLHRADAVPHDAAPRLT